MKDNPDSSHMAYGDPLLKKLIVVELLQRASFFTSHAGSIQFDHWKHVQIRYGDGSASAFFYWDRVASGLGLQRHASVGIEVLGAIVMVSWWSHMDGGRRVYMKEKRLKKTSRQRTRGLSGHMHAMNYYKLLRISNHLPIIRRREETVASHQQLIRRPQWWASGREGGMVIVISRALCLTGTVLVAFELMDIDGCLLQSLRFMHLPTSKDIGQVKWI